MKRKYSAGYFSSYDRGLACLLEMWPKIYEQVPKATLDIYYGWNIYDKMYANNPNGMKWKWTMIRKLSELKDMGVKEHGRVSHEELAKAMKDISVWLYPTEFTEIHCITALKTGEAGMQQVVTDVAALTETAPNATFINSQNIYSDGQAQEQFIAAAVKALKNPKPSAPPDNRYWQDIAKVWSKTMEGATK